VVEDKWNDEVVELVVFDIEQQVLPAV